MRVDVRSLAGVAFICALLLTSCGGQAGAPQFVQAFGVIESPCGIGAPPSSVVQHCTADLLIQNQGGEGYGHLTIVVQLKDDKAGAAPLPPIKCGTSVPDLPAGGYADLVCPFDVPPGQSVANYPIVQSIDFADSSTRGSSGSDSTALAALILTAATALIALAALIVIATARRQPSVDDADDEAPAQNATSHAARVAPRADQKPARPRGPDAEYDLPQLPR